MSDDGHWTIHGKGTAFPVGDYTQAMERVTTVLDALKHQKMDVEYTALTNVYYFLRDRDDELPVPE